MLKRTKDEARTPLHDRLGCRRDLRPRQLLGEFLMSDAERETLARLSIEHMAGRVPVIVTISHFATRIAVERVRFANDLEAGIVMLVTRRVAAFFLPESLRSCTFPWNKHWFHFNECTGIRESPENPSLFQTSTQFHGLGDRVKELMPDKPGGTERIFSGTVFVTRVSVIPV